MRKTSFQLTIVVFLILAALAVSACRGTPRPVEGRIRGDIPQFVKDALKDIPDDVLIGIGMAKVSTPARSMQMAETRALAAISRQIQSFVQVMETRQLQVSGTDEGSSSEVFREIFIIARSESLIGGASLLDMDIADDGTVWCVMKVDKSGVVWGINRIFDEAKLKDPAIASFDTQKWIDEAYAEIIGQEIEVTGAD